MTTPNECPRCGATTPHETLAKLAAVNIEQAERLRQTERRLRETESYLTHRQVMDQATISRLRAALERIAADEFSKVYQAVRVAADALNAKE